MQNVNHTKYDVVVIGGGIGGLVCACYLVRGGLQVLLVEKNHKPGGYCVSLGNKTTAQDVFAHSLGSCREGGNIIAALHDLGIKDKLCLERYSPSDIIVTPQHRISFGSNINDTIKELQNNYPLEANNIKDFFSFLAYSNSLSLRRVTFDKILNKYFKDDELKAIFGLLLFGNAGLPHTLISAFSATMLLKEFLMDGGYYPAKGMQAFPDTLVERFRELGGHLLLSRRVEKIKTGQGGVEGVEIEGKGFIPVRYVVSDCDATQTFSKLLNKNVISNSFRRRLKKMHPSLSMFIVRFDLDRDCKIPFPCGSNVWYLPHCNLNKMYRAAHNRKPSNVAEYMVRVSPGKKNLLIFVNAHFATQKFWSNYEKRMLQVLLREVEKNIPNLSRHIIRKRIFTPQTLFRWTLNYKGAAYGWEATPDQLMISGFAQITPVRNLYLTGHWATFAHGLRGVVYLGSATARLILKKEKNKCS